MANTKLLEREIHNFAGGRTRRLQLPFGLVYQTSPDQLDKVTSLAKGAVESRKSCTFVRCAILGFGPSSIDFELLFDSRTTDANKVAADRTAVALAILRTFAEHKLEFAYPTQTTFTAAPDGTMIMPYVAPGADQAASASSIGSPSGVILNASASMDRQFSGVIERWYSACMSGVSISSIRQLSTQNSMTRNQGPRWQSLVWHP